MEDKGINAFMILLRAGLWNSQPAHNGVFPLSDAEWGKVFNLAVMQTVDGLVYDGILKLPKELLPPLELQFKWTVRVDQIERVNKRKSGVLEKLLMLFQEHAIYPYLLKGEGLGNLYLKPEHRISGDIDLYFASRKEYDKANQLIQSHGIQVGKGALESSFYSFMNVEIEHHSRMMDILNPFKKGKLQKLEMLERSKDLYYPLHQVNVRTPSPFLTHIQANAHILKHFLGFGIGLRQFCDIARICNSLSKSIDGLALRKVYADLHMLKWMDLVHVFLVDYLGLRRDAVPFDYVNHRDSTWLFKEILQVGNFGFYDNRGFNKSDVEPVAHVKRNSVFSRVLPHWRRSIQLAPFETICFPIVKLVDQIQGRKSS